MKSLIAPHAMVMKHKGKIFPAKTGPAPSTKRVSGGIKTWGRDEWECPQQSHQGAGPFLLLLRASYSSGPKS